MKFNSKMFLSSVFAASLCVVGVSAMEDKKVEQQKDVKPGVGSEMVSKVKNNVTSAWDTTKQVLKNSFERIAEYLDLEGLDQKLKNDKDAREAVEAVMKDVINFNIANSKVVLRHFEVKEKIELALKLVNTILELPKKESLDFLYSNPGVFANVTVARDPNRYGNLVFLANQANYGSHGKSGSVEEKK